MSAQEFEKNDSDGRSPNSRKSGLYNLLDEELPADHNAWAQVYALDRLSNEDDQIRAARKKLSANDEIVITEPWTRLEVRLGADFVESEHFQTSCCLVLTPEGFRVKRNELHTEMCSCNPTIRLLNRAMDHNDFKVSGFTADSIRQRTYDALRDPNSTNKPNGE